jgi:acyl carrier protein
MESSEKREEKVLELLSRMVSVETGSLHVAMSLRHDLNMDSTEMVEVVVALEKAFSIKIENGDEDQFKTIKDIFDYVEVATKAQASLTYT